MAIVRPGNIIVDIRGKVGDTVYSRNNAGPFVRSRIVAPQVPTQLQLDQQALMTALSTAWSGTLTEPQRATWRQYAHQHPRPNRWGNLTAKTGQNAFVRANAYYYRIDQALHFSSAPPAPPLPPPAFTFTADAAADTITIALPPTTFPAPFAGLRLYAFIGEPTVQGVNYFNRSTRYAATNLYVPPWSTSPWTFASPYPIDVGQRVWAFLVAQHETGGQLSNRHSNHQTAT